MYNNCVLSIVLNKRISIGIAKLSSKFFSADKIINAEDQSSNMETIFDNP